MGEGRGEKKAHRVPKRLRIVVHPDLWDAPEVQELRAKGHDVSTQDDPSAMTPADLVLGPNCWRMVPELLKFLPLAVKAARAQRYPKKEKAGE